MKQRLVIDLKVMNSTPMRLADRMEQGLWIVLVARAAQNPELLDRCGAENQRWWLEFMGLEKRLLTKIGPGRLWRWHGDALKVFGVPAIADDDGPDLLVCLENRFGGLPEGETDVMSATERELIALANRESSRSLSSAAPAGAAADSAQSQSLSA